MAVWLSKHGVLIGLCSKNNPEDVTEVLEKHPDMSLKNENIVVSEVNWNDKASNLRMIAEELNIGIDSLVFVDDSSFEINLIREQLPQVVCMQVPEAIYDYPAQFAEIINTYFYFSDSKADLDKTNQYKQQAQRNQSKRQFGDIESYLKSLEMEVTFHVDDAGEIERVAQLTQKTNQLNLCTNRYTDVQIEAIRENTSQSYISLSVKDKFGDSGLTGVAIVSFADGKGEINDFLMSCRVMGRNIEFVFIDFIMTFLKAHGCISVKAQYRPTQKNKPVSEFFDKCGFPVISENGEGKEYALAIDEYKKQNIDYIKVN
jgi:FkbH-like protein